MSKGLFEQSNEGHFLNAERPTPPAMALSFPFISFWAKISAVICVHPRLKTWRPPLSRRPAWP